MGRVVFFGELEVAVIVCGYGHDGAGAVIHEHEVGGPYRDGFAVQGIDGSRPGKHAELFAALAGAGNLVLAFHFFDKGVNRLFLFGSARQRMRQRMLRREHHEGCAVQCVRPGGEHGDRFASSL